MNAVIYCRVSSKEQVDGTSLESQELACREYATRNRLSVVKVFVERGESAKFADRTQLLELMAFCRNKTNGIECLLVWKVDRLARNVGDHFNIKATLLQQNIRVISVTEPIDAKPEGKLLETILAGFAQFDNDLRAARTVQGMRRKIQEGLFPWRAPIGYRTVTHGNKKTEPDAPVEPAFRILQRAWQDFATGKFTKTQIIERITRQGLRTEKGKPLSAQSLDNILSDSFYAGILHDPWSSEEHMGRHLPMVDRETFDRVQKILGNSTHAVPHRALRPEFPLRGFTRCTNCESHLTGAFSRGRSQYYPYYRCFNRHCGAYGNYRLVDVHKEFLSFLGSLSVQSGSFRHLKCCIMEIRQEQSELKETLEAKRALDLKRAKDQQEELTRMKMDRLITDEEFLAQRSVLIARIGELEAAAPVDCSISAEGIADTLETIREPLMDLGSAWEEIPIEKRRRFQMMALPRGYVFGSVGTAPRGHLFSLLSASDTPNSSWVPPTGESWNQLATDIEAFAGLFHEGTVMRN